MNWVFLVAAVLCWAACGASSSSPPSSAGSAGSANSASPTAASSSDSFSPNNTIYEGELALNTSASSAVCADAQQEDLTSNCCASTFDAKWEVEPMTSTNGGWFADGELASLNQGTLSWTATPHGTQNNCQIDEKQEGTLTANGDASMKTIIKVTCSGRSPFTVTCVYSGSAPPL